MFTFYGGHIVQLKMASGSLCVVWIKYLTSVAVILKRTRLDNLVADGETEVGVIRQN